MTLQCAAIGKPVSLCLQRAQSTGSQDFEISPFRTAQVQLCTTFLQGLSAGKDSIGLIQLECVTGDLGAASSAAIDIAEQTPEQLQPFLLPAVMPLPGLADQVIADWHQKLQGRLMFPSNLPPCLLPAVIQLPGRAEQARADQQ